VKLYRLNFNIGFTAQLQISVLKISFVKNFQRRESAIKILLNLSLIDEGKTSRQIL
jgi:hypothetical protein